MSKWFSVLVVVLSIQPVWASEKLDRAMNALAAIEADPVKLVSFCAIKHASGAISAGVAVDRGDMKLDEHYENVGPEFDDLPELREELVADDAQSVDDALNQLLSQCSPEVAKLTP